MRNVWKWIIGIVIVLVVLAVVVGGAFFLRSRFNGIASVVHVVRPGGQFPNDQQGPNGRIPFNGNDQRRGPGWMMPFGGSGYHMRGPGMMGFGMLPFAGIFGGLFFLGFVVLVVLGIVWLVRSQNKPQMATATAGMGMVAAASVPEPPVIQAVASHSCKKCGQPVQEGWNHCPNCGKKQ